MKLHFTIPDDLIEVSELFKSLGFQFLLVGGCVRDAIISEIPKDFDLVTDALPDQILEVVRSYDKLMSIIEVGKSFGVIKIIIPSGEYEIATFRTDSIGSDGRRPDSVTFSDIYGDASRRDLTINSIYYDIFDREIIDPVGGVKDIADMVIRTVGSPRDRFDEDQLRILRVLRFSNRFGGKLSPDIIEVLNEGVDLSKVSKERIRDEFIKSVKSSISTKSYINDLIRYDLIKWVFPDIKIPSDSSLPETKDVEVLVAHLLMGLDTTIHKVGKYLNDKKYTIDEIRQIEFIMSTASFDPTEIMKFKKAQSISKVTFERVMVFLTNISSSVHVDIVRKAMEFELSVDPTHLMSTLGLTGKELGSKINELEIDSFMDMISAHP